jgi:succinate dehydrogenase flavin-adding protein (antitoxin of CptAB toxin-antitoxin module)
MTAKIMRQLWSVVESTQSKTLLQMDDASLVQWLVKQTNTQAFLDCKETDFLSNYIQSRLPLIRDIAHERQKLVSG